MSDPGRREDAAAWPADGPLTVGVEEEFFVLDQATHRLADSAPLLDALRGHLDEDGSETYSCELRPCMIESRTGICGGLDALRAQLCERRETLSRAAAGHALAIASSGTYPLADWRQEGFTSSPRYDHIARVYGRLAAEHLVCACHVHVGVEDRDTAVAVINRVRPWVPVLAALAASSPFWTGEDTGYASYRGIIWSHWPTAGMPPTLASYADHRERVRGLVAVEAGADAGQVFWDVRPGTRYHTVEFRIADACTTVGEAVLQAGLARALVRQCLTEMANGDPAPEVHPELLRVAKWRAVRFGLTERLVDPLAVALVPAAELVHRLLDHVRGPLTDTGDWAEVTGLVDQALRQGTSADRQRRALTAGAGLADVAELLVTETGNFRSAPSL
ncbi:glutamate--cysteine ligase [Streptomyces sp. NPDC017405]|uniref:carboxylate-amine ligase n=1 Tax=unclassified Streptomyces TaxID=2593676 RepID=UPI0037A63F05